MSCNRSWCRFVTVGAGALVLAAGSLASGRQEDFQLSPSDGSGLGARGLVDDPADRRWSSFRFYESGDGSVLPLDWDGCWPIQW